MQKTTTIYEELSKLDEQRENAQTNLSTYETPDMDKVLISAKQRLSKLHNIMAKGRKRKR